MKKALLIALMCIVPFKPNFTLIEKAEEVRFIQEEGLEYVYLSCYLPTGNRTADGTIPYEGICSCNIEHLGQDCIMYDATTLTPVARWECRDIGGNSLLKQGKAIDVFRTDMNRAIELKKTYGDHVYIKWVSREEGKDEETVSGNLLE